MDAALFLPHAARDRAPSRASRALMASTSSTLLDFGAQRLPVAVVSTAKGPRAHARALRCQLWQLSRRLGAWRGAVEADVSA